MKTIQIEKDPYDFGVNLFPKKNVTFEPGVTVLVGCNGSGKTTLHVKLRRGEAFLQFRGISCQKDGKIYPG